MGEGKLYKSDKEFIVNVDYQFHDESDVGWWGELVPTEYTGRLRDGEGFVLELEDGRRGYCSLRRRINRAVSGVPPIYHYTFRGRGPIA